MCENKTLPMKPFSDLKGKEFFIPYQQRGYKWTSTNVGELLKDLKEFIDNSEPLKRVYCLQPLAVVSLGENIFSVLDGQQRLTTLFLLYVYLYGEVPYIFKYERDQSDGGKMSRFEYLSNIAKRTSDEASQNIDFYYIYMAYNHIVEVFHQWGLELASYKNDTTIDEEIENLKNDFRTLLDANANEKSIQVIWYQVEENKQYETFRNLNSGKIHLTNTELIKALLLNRVSGLPMNERLEAAATFELIEREIQNDHFWYMFNGKELRSGQTRMDFLFNIVSGCTQIDYDIDSRWSFRNYFSDSTKGTLSKKWKIVRQTFLRLKDMYENIYCYHYIGFLTYNNSDDPLKNAKKWLEKSLEISHPKFVDTLKTDIKGKLCNKKHSSVSDYTFDQSDKKDLRLLFLMHNIETILQKYEQLHENKQLILQKEFEQFPFELLHKQSWDIEHIASNTDNDLKNPTDRQIWLESIKKDLADNYPTDEAVIKLEKNYQRTKKKEDFDDLYKAIMRRCDDMIEDSIKDDSDGKNKNQIGNLTLLDRHTNRSYHNALFPRKRKYIIVADGLCDKDEESEEKITKMYIPPCTRQVFTKAYTKNGNLSLNTWTQADADAYVKDMEQKLMFYFGKPQNS